MAVNPMLASGVNGITQAIDALDRVMDVAQGERSSSRAPSPVDTGADTGSSSSYSSDASDSHGALSQLAHDLVDVKLYQRQVQASAQVVETADEVLGFLVDVRV